MYFWSQETGKAETWRKSPGQRTSKYKGMEHGRMWHICQRVGGQGQKRAQPERLNLLWIQSTSNPKDVNF